MLIMNERPPALKLEKVKKATKNNPINQDLKQIAQQRRKPNSMGIALTQGLGRNSLW